MACVCQLEKQVAPIKRQAAEARSKALELRRADDKDGAAASLRTYKAYEAQVQALIKGDAAGYAQATALLSQVQLKAAQQRRQAVFAEVVRRVVSSPHAHGLVP